MTLALLGAGPTSGVAAFSPSSLSNLQGWYKADAGVLDASDSPITVDGTAVKTWQDQSSAAHHLAQATGVARPLWKASIANGLPSIRFDGVDDYLDVVFALPQPYQIIMVGKYLAAFATTDTMLGGTSARGEWARLSATSMNMRSSGGNFSVTTTPQSLHVISLEFNNASSAIRIDGGAATTGTLGASSTAPGGLRLGSRFDLGQPGNVDVHEVIVCSSIQSDANRQLAEAYLKARFGTP